MIRPALQVSYIKAIGGNVDEKKEIKANWRRIGWRVCGIYWSIGEFIKSVVLLGEKYAWNPATLPLLYLKRASIM
jgi:hypothetical protein